MATVTMIRLRPLARWVLVRPQDVMAETTKHRLVQGVDFSKEKPQTGVVLATGPELQRSAWNPMDPPCEPGDVVLYGKFAGTEVDLGDGEALVLDVKDILAVVEFVEGEVEDEPTYSGNVGGPEPSRIEVVAA
jgi:chaperonin GroES